METKESSKSNPKLEASTWQSHSKQYGSWLFKEDLSPHTKRIYESQINQFVSFLQNSNWADIPHPKDNSSLALAAQEYREFLKHIMNVGPSAINNSLSAIDHFCRFLKIEPPKLEREQRGRKAPNVLTSREKDLFLKAAERQEWARDRALSLVLFHSGMRLSECAALNTDDILIQGESSYLIFKRKRSPGATKLNHRRPLPVNTTKALKSWLAERAKLAPASTEAAPALWTTQSGKRLTVAGVDYLIRRIGWEAGLVLSAEILRQTCLAHIAQHSSKEKVARRLGGQMSLSTMARYNSTDMKDYQRLMETLHST